MIQDNNSIGNSCFIQSNDINSIILPPMNINGVQDHGELILNDGYLDMLQHQQANQPQLIQQHVNQQLIFDASLHQQLQQQQQQSIQQFQFDNRITTSNCGDYPPTPEDTPPINITNDLTMNEVSTSDVSTVIDGPILSQESFPYLQGLNSGNLLQCSQESQLQEMLTKEHYQGKPNLHILPTVEDHDICSYKFKLSISTQHSKGKTKWNYSDDLNKLYIRMKDTFTVDVVYTPKLPIQPLRLRSFICFIKEVSEPVLRCQNHLSEDNETNITKRESVLRCDNPNAEYEGTADGKSIKDRFSVTVPLTAGITQKDSSLKQTIAFKFTCQNSCIGRKETCIMFLLEGINGEILSQRFLNVRICSCPKRDKAHDEKFLKRKNDTEIFPTGAKILKRDKTSPTPTLVIKDENSCNEYKAAAKQFDLQRTASGGFRLLMEVSNKEIALSTIDYVIAKESANIINESKNAPRSRQNIRNLKLLYEYNV